MRACWHRVRAFVTDPGDDNIWDAKWEVDGWFGTEEVTNTRE